MKIMNICCLDLVLKCVLILLVLALRTGRYSDPRSHWQDRRSPRGSPRIAVERKNYLAIACACNEANTVELMKAGPKRRGRL